MIVCHTLRLGVTTLPDSPKFRRSLRHHLLQLPLFGRQSWAVHAHGTFGP